MTYHLVTGLAPAGMYDVSLEPGNSGLFVTIRPGSQLQADEGGVLVIQ